MEAIFSPEIILSFLTLTFLEIILGIDNLIFIAIVVNTLPNSYRKKARFIGIGLALIIRIIMLMTLSWIMGLTKPLFTMFNMDFSFNNILLITGGIFLVVKAGLEIYSEVFGFEENISDKTNNKKVSVKSGFFGAILQIALVDFVFSFDSIITAIGMTRNIPIIVAAVIVSMAVMLFASGYISEILKKHPSLKILALAFIFMIGVILIGDGINLHIAKGYLYFSLFFAIAIETLNILSGKDNRKIR